jgi:hypothetical protein
MVTPFKTGLPLHELRGLKSAQKENNEMAETLFFYHLCDRDFLLTGEPSPSPTSPAPQPRPLCGIQGLRAHERSEGPVRYRLGLP